MADLHDIGDHMARACECGCVRFNLLRSGSIECEDCQLKQENINWSEDMNPNYKPETEVTFSAEQIEQGKAIIRAAINRNQQCFWSDIVSEGNGSLPAGALLKASSEMQKAKELRLKEDSYEHAMEYILR